MLDLSHDKEMLKKLYRESKDAIEKDRYHALYVLSLGYSVRETARLFSRDEGTIRLLVERWLKERNVKNKPKEGAPRKVDERLKTIVVKLADENEPKKYRMNCSFWDCIELHKFFLMNGIYISRETIRRILKKNGFRYVKADYEYVLADEEEVEDFLDRFEETLKKREKGSSILFFDEMGTLLHPKKGYMWTRKRKALIKTHSSHQKVSALGAVNPLTGSSEVMFTSNKVNKHTVVDFLERLYKKFKGMIYLFLDKFLPHKSRLVKEFAESHPRLELIFLPSYCPNLNPVEWLWNFSRKKFLNNKVFKNKRQLISSFSWFIRRLSKSTISRVCNIDILVNRIT
jgi:transposase